VYRILNFLTSSFLMIFLTGCAINALEDTTPEITTIPTDEITNKLDQAVPETRTTPIENKCSLDQWEIDFLISGGFAGIQQGITINHNGEITAINEKLGEKIRVQASQNDIDEIEKCLTDICLSAPEKIQTRPSGECADCFQYLLNIETNVLRHNLETDDLALKESGFLPIITLLRNINMEIWAGEYES